jgi:D-amino-acid dehydrogenase
MRVCVIGAGITGLAAAWQLQREGHDVTVVDREGAGMGASAANGAQLSYAYVQPLADPSLWAQLPRLLLAGSSPLKLRLQWDPDQWRWGVGFLAACRGDVSRRTTGQLLDLAASSRRAFDLFRTENTVDCDFAPAGKLVLYSDSSSFEAARRQLALQQSLGTRQSAVTAAECVAIEPALHHYASRVVGGIHTPGECAADCYKVCQELLRILQMRGVRFQFGSDVTGFVTRRGHAVAAATCAGLAHADAFVVATGAASARLAGKLGVYLPVYPLKGYSITVPAPREPAAAPCVSVTDTARKVVFARIGERLRIAGMAELVGHDLTIPTDRIDALVAATRDIFPECGDLSACQPWAGLRPATPTGLPILGRHARGPANVLFNTGHGALGFTLAFGSAVHIASLLREPRPARAIAAAAAPASYSA